MMRHRQVMVGRRKILRLLASHRVSVHEKPQVRFGQALSEPVILVGQRCNDRLNRLQMLEHDGAMFLSGVGIELDRRAHIRQMNRRHTIDAGCSLRLRAAARKERREEHQWNSGLSNHDPSLVARSQ